MTAATRVPAGLLVAGVLVARGGPRRMMVTGRELAGCALIAVLLPALGQGLVTVGKKGGVTVLGLASWPGLTMTRHA